MPIDKLSACESFMLNSEQRYAVITVLRNPFSVIFGNSGVGKTTVLGAIFDQICDTTKIYPMALTGRAVSILKEKTGYDAQTIAKFIISAKKTAIPDNAWVFIDEASRLDLPTIYCLLKTLPDTVRICFIGDQCKLPPIGPGLVLHQMYKVNAIPQVELFDIHCQKVESEISIFANEIRKCICNQNIVLSAVSDKFLGLKKRDYGVSFIELSNRDDLYSEAIRTYNELASFGEVKIIAASNETCCHLNEYFASDYRLAREYKKLPCPLLELSVIGKPLQKQISTIGDMILWHSINDFQRDLYNGMLGELTQIYSDPIWEIYNGHNVKFVAEADFYGDITRITESDLEHIALGYAIPCHKAQVSQFERAIVIVEQTGTADLIDNPWLYTAITSAKRQVIMIGDKELFKIKVAHKSQSSKRVVGLHF